MKNKQKIYNSIKTDIYNYTTCHQSVFIRTYLVQFVSKSCNTWTKSLNAIDDDGPNGGSSKSLMVDDVDFLGKQVDQQASAQHVWP